jgi:hypothetical protein
MALGGYLASGETPGVGSGGEGAAADEAPAVLFHPRAVASRRTVARGEKKVW